MIRLAIFSLFIAISPSLAKEPVAQAEALPTPVVVDDYSRAYFIERAGEIGACIEEVPNPDLVMDSVMTVAALMAIQLEYQHCAYKLTSVLDQVHDWKRAILYEIDRQAVAQDEEPLVESSEPEQDELMAAFNAFIASYDSGTGTVSEQEEKIEPTPEKVLIPQERLLMDVEESIEQLDMLLVELELVQAVIQHKIISLRVEEQLKENPEPFGASL